MAFLVIYKVLACYKAIIIHHNKHHQWWQPRMYFSIEISTPRQIFLFLISGSLEQGILAIIDLIIFGHTLFYIFLILRLEIASRQQGM